MSKQSSITFYASTVVCLLYFYMGLASSRTIDEIIASSTTRFSDFDFMSDIDGAVIRLELDMLLTLEQYNELHGKQNFGSSNTKALPRTKRKATKSSTTRWTDKEIPYRVDNSAFTLEDHSEIMKAIKEWKNYTCIDFRNATRSDSSYINFEDGSGCSSYIGMGKGKRPISLAKGCRNKGVIAHEIGHAVGFYHEQNRPDRDDYVIIKKENIQHPDLYSNFDKYPWSAISTYDVPYDYTSIMHYGGMAFSGNGQYTIQTLDPEYQKIIGNREGLSFNDIKLANLMYSCSEKCTKTIICPKEGFLSKDCTCWCPGSPVKKCDGSGPRVITTRPSVKTTKQTMRPTFRPTLPTVRPTIVRPTSTICIDINPNCREWAKSGYCQKSEYVQTYCKSSCSMCGGRRVTTPACQDTRLYCSNWGKKGYCLGTSKAFMKRRCPETCGYCETRSRDNIGEISSYTQTAEDKGSFIGTEEDKASYTKTSKDNGANVLSPRCLIILVGVICSVVKML